MPQRGPGFLSENDFGLLFFCNIWIFLRPLCLALFRGALRGNIHGITYDINMLFRLTWLFMHIPSNTNSIIIRDLFLSYYIPQTLHQLIEDEWII
jgi:hypothetical protein